jgi:hypothetical protein
MTSFGIARNISSVRTWFQPNFKNSTSRVTVNDNFTAKIKAISSRLDFTKQTPIVILLTCDGVDDNLVIL